MRPYSRVYAQIDLDAIRNNMEEMEKELPKGTKIIGIVKADGYGHGSVPVAKAIDPFVQGYGVATVEEALLLRRHAVTKPILVLGVVHESQYEEMIRQEIRPTLFEKERLKAYGDLAGRLGKKAPVHLALDTGMSRIGMEPDEQGADMAAWAAGHPGLFLEGLFTHFARADETDKTKAYAQLERYRHFVSLLKERGVEIPIKHCANSAGIIEHIGLDLDAVRAGISIYGMYPSDEVDKTHVRLHPALSLKSFVTYVKTLAPGREISYGGTFTTQAAMRVATIPVGYGDGYPRNLSGKGWVLIRGEKAPILGRVCMDQFMVDVTHIQGVKEDDPVTLIGQDNGRQITVEDLARAGGGFHYEIVCDIGKRVPRVYLSGGQVVGKKDYFQDSYEDF